MISRRVNANAYLTRLNLCINGAYGPIDSELWLHRARTQAGDMSHLEICSQIVSDNLNQYVKCYSKALPQKKERPFKTEAFLNWVLCLPHACCRVLHIPLQTVLPVPKMLHLSWNLILSMGASWLDLTIINLLSLAMNVDQDVCCKREIS